MTLTFTRTLWLSAILAIGGLLSACDTSNVCDVGPPTNCITIRPSMGELRVEVSYTNQPQGIPITIYRGRFDQGVVYARDTVWGENILYLLPTNEYFSVTAEYVQDGRKIVAVDGVRVTVSEESRCDYDCYTSSTNRVNLRVRKYF